MKGEIGDGDGSYTISWYHSHGNIGYIVMVYRDELALTLYVLEIKLAIIAKD